jgi:hypothetical protein
MNYGIGQAIGSIPQGELTKSREADSSREFEIMEKEIARLSDSVGHLIQRIDPICRPAEPSPNVQSATPNPIMSAFASRLASLRRRLSEIGDAVASTHGRLDL